ncbi:MAG: AIPR family protein [Oligoflexales bacterium]|nr:AIPR family protein [Oligoflexales bacterium]
MGCFSLIVFHDINYTKFFLKIPIIHHQGVNASLYIGIDYQYQLEKEMPNMLDKSLVKKEIEKAKKQYRLEREEENVIATIHLMNKHSLDLDSALDQSSNGNNDYGIDGWYFDDLEDPKTLFIYQSKTSDQKKQLCKMGFDDLVRGAEFIKEEILGDRSNSHHSNHSIRNLVEFFKTRTQYIEKIEFHLLSIYSHEELIDEINKSNAAVKIREIFKGRKIKFNLRAEEFCLVQTVPNIRKVYNVQSIPNTEIMLREDAYLRITYLPLLDLVRLYQQRSDDFFHHNVRHSLYDLKGTRGRVAIPMERTIKLICEGKEFPEIFPFYHIGITMAAELIDIKDDLLQLRRPFVLNGCQTITCAERVYKKIYAENKEEELTNFKKIKVLVKLIVGTTDKELRDVTNNNNRQNPIEPWQLFCNYPIHHDLEIEFDRKKIFYQRQKGKFETTFKNKKVVKEKHDAYANTNNTFIDMPTLGQAIALIKGEMVLAAKPTEIFAKEEHHKKIFHDELLQFSNDMICCFNLLKSAKTTVRKYFRDENTPQKTIDLLDTPRYRNHFYRLLMIGYYQKHNDKCNEKYSTSLLKKASTDIIEEMMKLMRTSATKIKIACLEIYKKHKKEELTSDDVCDIFDKIASECKVYYARGLKPFTNKSTQKKVA